MRILWASPLPPTRSGVSDYAVELLDELRRLVEIRVVRPPEWRVPDDWPLEWQPELVDPSEEPRPDEINVVHLGNNPHHEWLLTRLGVPGTVVVLHDLVLHHLLVEATLARSLEERYRELMGRGHGAAGNLLGRARLEGITGPRDPFLFPCRKAFLSGVAGVIVHSRWGRERVAKELPGVAVRQVGLAVADPGPGDRSALRGSLGAAPDTVLVMHVGFLTPEKGARDILGALAAASSAGVRARLVMVGEGRERSRLAGAVSALGLESLVSFTGYVPRERFGQLPSAADLGVVLRTPSAGETSAAAVRFMACGAPVAVSGVHQFLEWPESAAPRITPGAPAAAELARLICDAAGGGTRWDERRAAARAAYEKAHVPGLVARQLVAAIGALGV